MAMKVIDPTLVDTIVFTRAGTATYQNATGVLQTAAVNVRRPLYTQGAMNLVLYSQQLDNAYYTKSAVTVTANTTLAPDGTMTADRMAETAVTSTHYSTRSIHLVPGATYTLSVYVQAYGSRTFRLQAETTTGTYIYAVFNLTTGAVISSSAGVVTTIASAANGFYRVSITFTAATPGTTNLFFMACDAAGNQSYLGSVTSGVYLWGLQLEKSAVPTTYIPTTTDVGVLAGVQSGYIYEPNEATNLLTNSLADSSVTAGGTWTLGTNTTRVGVTTAPDGTNTAAVYQATALGNCSVSRSMSRAASTVYTFSIWAKVISGSPTTGSLISVQYDSDNNVGSLEVASLPILNSGLDTTWKRFSLTVTNVAALGSASNFYAVDFTAGVQIAIWGAQVEVGYLSSFIPTTTATVTRPPEYLLGSSNTFISSNIPEDDYAVWNPFATYIVGSRVIRSNHRIYENVLAGVNSTPPEIVQSPPVWLDIGPTNRWAMFDGVVGTTTKGGSEIVVVLQPGQVDSIAFQELMAETVRVVVKDNPGGNVVYDRLLDLEFSFISDFYDWFFSPYESRTDALFSDLPLYSNCEITVTISGAGSTACGLLVVGNAIEIGETQYGAQIGILNYSVKEVDDFGTTVVTPRGYARRMDLKVWMPSYLLNRTYRCLSELRDKPCIWVATETRDYEALIVYGFYRDFTIDIAYFDTNICNLQIEGLT